MHDSPPQQSPRLGCKERTCEELHDKQAPHNAREDRVPNPAPALITALVDVQHLVPPKHPGPKEVQEAEGQYNRRAGRIGQRDDVEQHDRADLAAIPD